MEVKPLTLANIVLTTILLTSMFFLATRSASTVEYDSWLDYNDDGKIDLVDLYQVIMHYGAEGTPINKTALLLELQSQIHEMNATITELKEDITILNSTMLGKPGYDSGWTVINYEQTMTFTHNLGTTELLVYVIGKHPDKQIHQMYYGGNTMEPGATNGLFWYYLDTNTIKVLRTQHAGNWWEVRVIIWKIP